MATISDELAGFLFWYVRRDDEGSLSADCDSKDDRDLQEYERQGFLRAYDCHFGKNYYAMTEKVTAELSR